VVTRNGRQSKASQPRRLSGHAQRPHRVMRHPDATVVEDDAPAKVAVEGWPHRSVTDISIKHDRDRYYGRLVTGPFHVQFGQSGQK